MKTKATSLKEDGKLLKLSQQAFGMTIPSKKKNIVKKIRRVRTDSVTFFG